MHQEATVVKSGISQNIKYSIMSGFANRVTNVVEFSVHISPIFSCLVTIIGCQHKLSDSCIFLQYQLLDRP